MPDTPTTRGTLDTLDQQTFDALATHGAPLVHRGKVRDTVAIGADHLALIATDRLSAFDRIIGHIPCKGQVLTEVSAFWNGQLAHVVDSHLVRVIDANVTLARRAEPLPVEVVVRGYITGVTSTSIWPRYARGERTMYGVTLSDGLEQNDALPEPIITPTTKAADGQHDEPITAAAIVRNGVVDESVWAQVERAALELFREGSRIAHQSGLVLVDTKYEFGLIDGRLVVIDEVHTPDSSRFWRLGTHDHLDKELVRRWLVDRGYRGDGPSPVLDDTIVHTMASAYREVYERLLGKPLVAAADPAQERIRIAIESVATTRSLALLEPTR